MSSLSAPIRFAYEMTISHADFLRTLPTVLEGMSYAIDDKEISVESEGRRLCITLSEQSQRRFGPISLPVTHVELKFDGYSEEEMNQFKSRFDTCYRRGGG
jgi:hypothetical protein